MRVTSEKQMKIMQVKASERTACLVIVVPGGAELVKLWAPTGFQTEDSSRLYKSCHFNFQRK